MNKQGSLTEFVRCSSKSKDKVLETLEYLMQNKTSKQLRSMEEAVADAVARA